MGPGARPYLGKDRTAFPYAGIAPGSQEDHQRIFSALVARDADGARQAMRNHLERVIGEFAQGWR
ncbi:FCD domain-containing protein [Achromobacter xylosoxidans]